ncbi:MAG: hypothetical protein IH898_11015 [Planctomycetes bacterium]|nr:hypothetical protein [Planctomycetota bacterium]
MRYWEYAQGYYRKNGKPTGEIDCLKSALRPVRELYGSHSAREFGPLALETVRQQMIARDPAMYCFRPIDSEAKRRAEVHTNRKSP